MKRTRSKESVREVSVSEFPNKLPSLLAQVERTKVPIRLTKRGKAVAEIIPVAQPPKLNRRDWLGSLASTTIIGDVVSPVVDLKDIEALKGLNENQEVRTATHVHRNR